MEIRKLVDAIIHEDGHNLSSGSLRSLQMIKEESLLLSRSINKTTDGSCRDTGHNFEFVSELQRDICTKCGKED